MHGSSGASGRVGGWGTALTTLAAPVSWGTTYVTVTELLPDDRPLLVAALRVAPAGLLLATIGWLRSGWRPARTDAGIVLVPALCNFGLFFPLLIVAVYRLPGGVAAAAGGIQPLLVGAVTWLVTGRRPGRLEVSVGVGAAAGVAMVVIRPGAGIDPVGVMAAVGANLSFAAGVVATKRLRPPEDRVAATGWQLLAASAVLLPVAFVVEGRPPALDPVAVAGFAHLSLVATGVAFLAWYDGIRRLPTAAPPLLGLAAPVTGATLGWLLLDEDLSPVQLTGFAITVASIAYGATLGPAGRSMTKPRYPSAAMSAQRAR